MPAPLLVTRFAPSPNGHLHLGHAYSAVLGYDLAMAAGGEFLLRIEDIDGPRSRPEFAEEFRRDLEWLGLEWREVAAQSTRLETYAEAARNLLERGYLYPCDCTRSEIAALPKRVDEDGFEYPGSCRAECASKASEGAALRLDIDRARAAVGEIVWDDDQLGGVIADPRPLGDVVIVRKDLPASYNLAVTLDDAADGVTLVTRGMDLLETTHIHRVLQALRTAGAAMASPRAGDRRKRRETGQTSRLAPARCAPEAGEDGRALADRLRARKFDLGS